MKADTGSWIELDPRSEHPDIVEKACAILGTGGLAVLPTDTGYALCGDALDETVLANVYSAKGRDPSKPVSVMVADLELARTLVELEPQVERIARALLPGALTLVLPRARDAPEALARMGGTLGIRIPDHPFTLAVLRRLGRPLTATSANPSGGISPHRSADLTACLELRGVVAVFDAGDLPLGRASTIVEILPGVDPVVLREGPVDLFRILEVS